MAASLKASMFHLRSFAPEEVQDLDTFPNPKNQIQESPEEKSGLILTNKISGAKKNWCLGVQIRSKRTAETDDALHHGGDDVLVVHQPAIEEGQAGGRQGNESIPWRTHNSGRNKNATAWLSQD